MAVKNSKSFFELTRRQKEVVVARLAKGTDYKDTHPLSEKEKALWDAARRGPGRPRKQLDSKSVAVQVTFEPKLLQKIDAYAAQKHMSRAELLAQGARLAMGR